LIKKSIFALLALVFGLLVPASCSNKATVAGDSEKKIVIAFANDNFGEVAPCG
jgi:uncharacterized lipoprotein NlpE involved in copper resistance